MIIELSWFAIGNIFTFMGTILLIQTVLKNRKMLKDYSIIGSLLTAIAMMCFMVAFHNMQDYVAMILLILTLLYWLIVSVISIINKIKKIRNEPELRVEKR